LLLADEPTGALDSATTREVMELLCDLHRQGMTVVIVTHDAGVACYAERRISFQDGRLTSDVVGQASAVPLGATLSQPPALPFARSAGGGTVAG
jgi:ABC-type lipoprotein export system ATPase subunit